MGGASNMKTCIKCGKLKPLDDFRKAVRMNDGHRNDCKKCEYAIKKAHRETEKGKFERKIESKKYRESNLEIVKERNNINNKKYMQTPKGKEQMYKRNMIRRSRGFKVDFTPHQRMEIINRDNWTCQCCGIKVHDEKRNDERKAHIDHIIPISKGGNSSPENLRLLCRTCNLSKSDKIII
jgi:5-methylcytosine-specific restriction endonuclease McrA